MKVILGLDIGTSGVKAVFVSEAGVVVSAASRNIDLSTPQIGYAEQHPNMWWDNACVCIRQAVAKLPAGAMIAAVGVTGQMHGTVLLDEAMNPVCPAIVWCDQRSNTILEELDALIRSNETHVAQNPMFTGVQATTLYWLSRNNKELLKQVSHVLLPKDYIRYRLTGSIGAEHSDASATLLYDISAENWDFSLIKLLGFEQSWFPPIARSDEIAGTTLAEVEQQTGLLPGIPVCYGGGDAQCQSLAIGLNREDVVISSVRTGGDVIAVSAKPVFDHNKRLLTLQHVVRGQSMLLAATLSCGLSLKWFTKQVLEDVSFAEADQLAAACLPGKSNPLFLPYLTGERTPLMDPDAKGVFWGITLGHGKSELLAAVMEGMIFSLRSCLELVEELGVCGKQVIVSGGGAKSKVMMQLWADVFGLPVHRSLLEDQAPIGAAMLAGVAAGVFTDLGQASQRICKVDANGVESIPKNTAIYRERYQLFRSLYDANKALFRCL